MCHIWIGCSCVTLCNIRERDREMKTGQEWVSDAHLQIWTTWVLVAALLFLVGFGFWVLVIRTVWRRRRRRRRSPAMISSSSSSEKQALHASACSVQITDEELYNFLEVLKKEEDFDNGDDEPQWENTVEKKSHIVAYSAKRRDPKDGGATEYLSSTVFENCSTRLLRDFYMDSDFRAEWDKTLVQHRQLQVCQITGTEVGLMIKKFPMMIAREYVLAWRIWEGDEHSYYCVLKACEHPDAPRQPQYKRVDKYVSGWRIRKVPGRDASEVKMVHQEDMGVQREMAKMVFRRGIWSFVQKMDMHLRRYANQCSHLDEAVNAVSLAHKVPMKMKETFPVSEDVHVPEATIQQSKMHRSSSEPVSKSDSKRNLVRGLLVLGGAMFLTHGSASLGAKLAAVCIVNRVIRPHDSSTNIFHRIVGRF
ncbi:unnamed protein product [Sphagnum troendelagicum]|uniref:START domain-containing protein n=1 Tax=Sphagnum troendelagicum TaxID=128251 RepID=A0ABP0UVW9_9BRYO